MNQENVDAELLRTIATRLATAHQNPPTVMGILCKWPGTPMFLIAGAIGTGVLVYLATLPNSGITSHWPIGVAAMVFGVAIRDLGFARRSARLWLPQSHFIDWEKVDEFKA